MKHIVNCMTVSFAAVPEATASTLVGTSGLARLGGFTLTNALLSIGLWGATRIASNVLLCYQMNYITEVIQAAIKKIS